MTTEMLCESTSKTILRSPIKTLAIGVAITMTFAASAGCGREGLSTAAVRDTVANGLTIQFSQQWIPIGPVTVITALEAQLEPADPSKKRYDHSGYDLFKMLAAKGMLTLQEQQQSGLASLGRMGAVTVTVTPTEKARALADKNQTNPGYLVVTLAQCEVLSIVRDTAYSSPALPASDQFKLVMGTFRFTPTEFALAVDSTSKGLEARFKAVLRFDPFAKVYKYGSADWGPLNSEAWSTHFVQ